MTAEQMVVTKDVLEEMMGAYIEKHTPASTTLTGRPLHGPSDTTFRGPNNYGIFSYPGVRPQRFTTLVRPNSLASLLAQNIQKSNYTEEILEVMTGVTAAAGTNSTSWCGTPPTVGEAKVCQQIYKFGNYHVRSHLNAIPEKGQLRNRAEVPAEIYNLGTEANPLIPDLLFRMADPLDAMAYEFFLVGVQAERVLDEVLIQGLASNAANNIHGWSLEFDGIDRQIRTGYTDRLTSTTCPAMDSIVETFSAAVGGTNALSENMVHVLSKVFRGLKNRARKMQMQGTSWAIVMREELFFALVDAYSCLYHRYKCSGSQYEENNIDQVTTNQLRLAMLEGEYLLIDGMQIPVVFSEGIEQSTVASNTFQSDLYVLPLSWMGIPLSRLEYFPMDNQYIQAFNDYAMDSPVAINNGLWLVGHASTPLCREYHFASKMRFILETPFLAARVDNIQYSFNAEIRNAIPDASYYKDGGVSRRILPAG
jgi:hypothetical protein